MVNLFLKAKHWQIFMFTFGFPLVFSLSMFSTMFSEFSNLTPGYSPDPQVMLSHFKTMFSYFPFIIIPAFVVQFNWMWSLGVGIQQKIPPHLKMKTGIFKLFITFPAIYLLLIIIFIINMSSSFIDSAIQQQEPPPDFTFLSWIPLIILVHLFSMVCLFYSMYYAAKAYKTAELQRAVKFEDFIGEFFLIWFYPIGIWILQPKVNQLIIDPNKPSDGLLEEDDY